MEEQEEKEEAQARMSVEISQDDCLVAWGCPIPGGWQGHLSVVRVALKNIPLSLGPSGLAKVVHGMDMALESISRPACGQPLAWAEDSHLQ